jgi:hypothetical protein
MHPKLGPRALVARSTHLVTVLSLLLVASCASGLKVTMVKSAQTKPSNVAVYFKVQESSGDPVGGLTADQFHIYEDESLVSPLESKQTILNPEVAASHYTLLLVDMSGSVSSSGSTDKLVEAADTFSQRVGKSHKVAVFAFDGSPDIHPIVPFTESAGSAKAGVKQLATYKPADPSTNLNGAVIKGLEELDRALSQAEHPMRFGTLVVFTDGTDRAARVSADDMKKHVKDSKYDIFSIGLGSEINDDQLKDIGKDGTAKAQDKDSVVKAFDTIGQKIESSTKSYYLLSYCSPARAGKHKVRIEAVYKTKDGAEKKGSVDSAFDAEGFAAGCDPNTPPQFDVTKGDALGPKDAPKPDDRGKPKGLPVQGGGGATNAAAPKLPPPPPPQAPAKPQEQFTP